MSDMDNNPTEQVSAQKPTEAAHYNLLEMFARYWGIVEDDYTETPNENVDLPNFFQRFIQNAKPEILSTNKIRVPYTADRPPSLVVDGHLLQATGNVDSATITGSAGTLYIMAVRSGSTFTLSIRTSGSEGTDERCIGYCEWDGSAVIPGSIVGYEVEGFVNRQQLAGAWGCVGSTGTLYDNEGITSAVRNSTGNYTITLDQPRSTSNYVVVVTLINNALAAYIQNMAVGSFDVILQTFAAVATDSKFSFIVFGSV